MDGRWMLAAINPPTPLEGNLIHAFSYNREPANFT
jgi:hypothetical protein